MWCRHCGRAQAALAAADVLEPSQASRGPGHGAQGLLEQSRHPRAPGPHAAPGGPGEGTSLRLRAPLGYSRTMGLMIAAVWDSMLELACTGSWKPSVKGLGSL